MYEHKLLTFRGWPNDAAQASLNELGAEGWQVATAYAVPELPSTMVTHVYVLKREIEPDAAPVAGKAKGKAR